MRRLPCAARLGRALKQDETGATALELALLAPMFIAIAVATIQIGFLELMSSNLDAAVMDAARKVRTGASDRPSSSEQLEIAICAKMIDSPADCRQRLVTSVQRVGDFAAGQASADATPTGQFNAGGPEDIILLRATYRLPLVLPMYAGNFQLSGPTEAVLDTRAAFRNEPYA